MNFSEIKYKKNFIKQVICRVDFLEFIPNEIITTTDVVRRIREAFPVTKMQQTIKFSNIGIVESTSPNAPPSVTSKSQDGIQLEYLTHDSKNRLSISNRFIFVDFSSYSTFEEMRDKFLGVIKELFSKVRLTTSRSGLRYINIFSPEELAIKKTHLARSIAGTLDASQIRCDGCNAPIRSISLSEYRKDNMIINFRFGLFNKYYPNPPKGNDFVLDFDCFTLDTMQDYTDLVKAITDAHTNIQALFENSISETLRRIMRNE